MAGRAMWALVLVLCLMTAAVWEIAVSAGTRPGHHPGPRSTSTTSTTASAAGGFTPPADLTTGVPASPTGSISASEPNTPTPVPPENGPPAGSHLAFSDHFAGNRLDRDKWTTCYPWDKPSGCTNANNGELEWYLPQQVSVSDGMLHLTADRQATPGDGQVYPYRSGLVTTYEHFSFEYGYLRFWARWPQGRGLWPGVWMLPTNLYYLPEIDVLEVNDKPPGSLYENYHSMTDVTGNGVSGVAPGWHEFSLDWQPGSLTFAVDGTTVFVVTKDVPQTPMYLLANLAVGGSYPGTPDASTTFPATFDVAALEVWEP